MRQVFKTDELAHIWAHQGQGSGRNPNNSCYFEGDTIFSYGSHYPIAKLVTTPSGEQAVLLNGNGSTHTTQMHRSAVYSAVNHLTVFDVDDPKASMEDHIKHFQSRIDQAFENINKGSKALKLKRIQALNKVLNTAFEFSRFFELNHKFVVPSFSFSEDQLKDLQLAAEKHTAMIISRRAAKCEADRLRWEAYKGEQEAKNEALKATFETRVEIWRNGGAYNFKFGEAVPTMLRIVGGEVETSKHAVFPLKDAIKALNLLKTLERGRDYIFNGVDKAKLGMYHIDSVDSEGTVRAGCHIVKAVEIEVFSCLVDNLR